MINLATNYMLERSPLVEYVLTDKEFYNILKEALYNLIESNSTMIFHHIDENRKNNDPSNILLIASDAHTSLHSAKSFAKIVNLLGWRDAITSIYDERAYRQELAIMRRFVDSYLYDCTLDALSDVLKAPTVLSSAASDYSSFKNDPEAFDYRNITAFSSVTIPFVSYNYLNSILGAASDIGVVDRYSQDAIDVCLQSISSLISDADPECQDIYQKCLTWIKHLND